MKKLEGKVAFVTGGSRGIGAGVVARLANEGAQVAFTFNSSPDRADEVVKAIEKLGDRAVAIQADSADADALVAAIDHAAKEFGGIDILVNNAGVLAVGPLDFTVTSCILTSNHHPRKLERPPGRAIAWRHS